MRTIVSANPGINVVLTLNNTVLAGQQDAILNQEVEMIDISNQITKSWVRSIPTLKTWTITCNGLVIKNQTSFNLLEAAFINGTKITLSMTDNDKTFSGEAYISAFPVQTKYDDTFTYKITLKGTGGLSYTD